MLRMTVAAGVDRDAVQRGSVRSVQACLESVSECTLSPRGRRMICRTPHIPVHVFASEGYAIKR